MTDELQVVARYKTGGFTKTATIEEILKQVATLLPIDLIYFVVPYPDGKGYSLREAGAVVLNIHPLVPIEAPVPTLQPPQPFPFIPGKTPTNQPELAAISSGPLPPYSPPMEKPHYGPPSDSYSFGNAPDAGLVFEKPKSQAELLAERGLEQPGSKVGNFLKKLTSKKGKGKHLKVVDASGAPDLPDDQLPTPPKAGGTIKINSISTATPAESEAASHFGKDF